jgi:asparagine synthase (glutamine-hydrolysing)
MCGICGVYNFDQQPAGKDLVQAMCSKLAHRGPDEQGLYVHNNVGLGHTRLSIIDLKSGQQPIHNEAKTIWLTVNGEIYNFRHLRNELEKQGHVFYTQTDSEVIVHLYEQYQEDAVKYLRGMFCFAIWDKTKKKLIIGRDRMGQKPLVYWHDQKKLVFASELQALLEAPWIKPEIDLDALNLYLSFLYVPAPKTMFKNVKKLLPGHYLVVQNDKVRVNKYWELNPKINPKQSFREYKQGILDRFDEAVKMRLVSDVPLGVFLSGGIDSSAIVAQMSRHLTNIKTFSVGFENKRYNELEFARIIAKKFSTDHHQLIIQPKAIEIMPKLISRYGEPYADYSCIPTYYLSEFAARHVKVALCGDGGDECFSGYYRYTAAAIAEIFDFLPGFLSRFISRSAVRFIPAGDDIRSTCWQAKRFFQSLNYSPVKRYLNWISCFSSMEKQQLFNKDIFAMIRPEADFDYLNSYYRTTATGDFADKTRQVDMDTYLPNDLLVKTDIASMANSLEARAPFLDHEFIEYVSQIPHDLKLHNFKNKYIFKKAYQGILPNTIINRKKQGFGIPIGQWFRNELKDYAYSVLLDKNAFSIKFFEPGYLRYILESHIEGKTDNGYKLWTLLMFELWAKEFIES